MPTAPYLPAPATLQRVADALAPDQAKALLDSGLPTPAMRRVQQTLHRKALLHNWSDGVPRRIVEHPCCDYGTALAIYWMGRPVHDQQYATLAAVPAWRRPVFRFLRGLEKRLLARDFVSASQRFDPTRDRGPDPSRDYDWTADDPERPILRPIPAVLRQASPPPG